MNNLNKELPKALTIEDLQKRVNKPVFLAKYNEISNRVDLRWAILKTLNEEILEFTDGVEDLKIGDNICFFDKEATKEDFFVILKQEKEKQNKKTGYETVGEGEDYFFVDSDMKVEKEYSYQYSNSVDAIREECGNHFNDETLTINLARAERLRYQLRRFAALNGGITSVAEWFGYYSWEDGCNWKHFIEYDYENQKMQINCTLTNKSFGQIYFKSEEACKKAIEIFEKELIWYFTEFEEQLY